MRERDGTVTTNKKAIIAKHVAKVKEQMRVACVDDDPQPTEDELQEGAEFIVHNMLAGMNRSPLGTLIERTET
jgi:hypothetical protein